MQVRRLLIACAGGLLLAGPAAAAPVRDEARNTPGPTFVFQVRSLDDLLARIKATAKSFLPDEMYREFEQHALPDLDPKKLPGVDPGRPGAFYATIDAGVLQSDFSKSQAVFLIPVSGEKEFISLLQKGGMTVTAQKDEGLHAIELPNLPLNVFMRFAKNYAYISLGSSAAVEPKALPDANEVIDRKESALAVFRGRIDRVPQELKDAVLGFVGTMAETFRSMPGPEPVREAMEQYIQLIQRWYKMGLEGGRDLVYRVDLDPNSGLVLDTTLTAKPKSKLADSIAAVKPNQNRFASLLGNGSAAHGSLSLPLFIPEIRQIAVKLAEAGAKEAQAEFERGQAPKQAQDVTAEFFNSLIRTFKDGTFDLAASLRGPDQAGHFAAVGAVTLKETADLEKALKEAVKVLPMQAANFIKLDAHKAGERSVHELAVGEMLPPEAQRIFGKASVYLCFAPDAVYVSFGTDGLALIKEALDAKRAPAPFFALQMNGKRVADLVRTAAGKENLGPQVESILGLLRKHERFTLLGMDVQGGEELRIHVDYGVLPFAILWVGAARAVGAGPPVPPVAVPAPAQIKK